MDGGWMGDGRGMDGGWMGDGWGMDGGWMGDVSEHKSKIQSTNLFTSQTTIFFSEVQLFQVRLENASPLAKEKMFGMLLQQAQQLMDIVANEEDEDEDEETRASELETIATWIWELIIVDHWDLNQWGKVLEDFFGSTAYSFPLFPTA